MRTRLPQFATLIPALGYAVLWSDQFQGWIMKFTLAFGSGGLLSPLDRITFLYFGSIVVLAGMLAFWAMCPRPLRYGSRREYIRAAQETEDPKELKLAGEFVQSHWKEELGSYQDVFGVSLDNLSASTAINGTLPNEAVPALAAYYEGTDITQPIRSGLTFILLAGGGLLFLVPSIEVFGLAILRLLGRLAGTA